MGMPGAGRGQSVSGAQGGIGVERALTSVAARTGGSVPQGSGFLSLLEQALSRSVAQAAAPEGGKKVSSSPSSDSSSGLESWLESLSSDGESKFDVEWLASLRQLLPQLMEWLSLLRGEAGEGSSWSIEGLAAMLKDLKSDGAAKPESDPSDELKSAVAGVVQSLVAVAQTSEVEPTGSDKTSDSDAESDSMASTPIGAAQGGFGGLVQFLRRLDYILHLIQRCALALDRGSSAGSLTDLTDVAPTSSPLDGASGKTGGTQSTDENTVQLLGEILANRGATLEETGGRPLTLGDRIYYSANALPGENTETLDAGRIRLVSLPAGEGEDPIAALQSLIDDIRGWKRQEAGDPAGERPSAPAQQNVWSSSGLPDAARFLSEVRYRAMDPALASRVDTKDAIEAVRQAQAAISDMVERMKGDVNLDPRAMRAVIHLEPPSLGRLHVRLAIEDGQGVQARFDSDQSGTMNFLRQNQEDLRQELAHQGFEEQRIRLEFGPGGEFAETLDRSTVAA